MSVYVISDLGSFGKIDGKVMEIYEFLREGNLIKLKDEVFMGLDYLLVIHDDNFCLTRVNKKKRLGYNKETGETFYLDEKQKDGTKKDIE